MYGFARGTWGAVPLVVSWVLHAARQAPRPTIQREVLWRGRDGHERVARQNRHDSKKHSIHKSVIIFVQAQGGGTPPDQTTMWHLRDHPPPISFFVTPGEIARRGRLQSLTIPPPSSRSPCWP